MVADTVIEPGGQYRVLGFAKPLASPARRSRGGSTSSSCRCATGPVHLPETGAEGLARRTDLRPVPGWENLIAKNSCWLDRLPEPVGMLGQPGPGRPGQHAVTITTSTNTARTNMKGTS